jgi:hypothetical protein
MENYIPGVGISAGCLMLKWDLLNSHIHRYDKIEPGDNVNVFINFESILRNLTMKKNINESIMFHKQKVVLELESAILNLVANYKMYFNKERTNSKIYLYYTELTNTDHEMTTYNKFYRSYYSNKYLQNPQFKSIGQLMTDIIIPEIELILSYIPNCYFIKSKRFDGSLIPAIISELDPESKNVIITSDVFDTLYLFKEKFTTVYIKRRYANFKVISDVESSVQSIVSETNPFDLTIFNSEMYYKLLLSIKGSRIRNIKSAKGFGYCKFLNLLTDGMDRNIVLKDYGSINSVIDLFPEKYRIDIKTAFDCTNLDIQHTLLTDSDIESIKLQIVDNIDTGSIEVLNNKRFLDFPINLQGLIG